MANANDIVYSRKNASGTDFVEKTLVPVANYFVICGPDGDLTTFTGSIGGGGTSLETGSTYPITSSWAVSSSWSPSTGGTSLNTGSTYPFTSSWSVSSSYAPSLWIQTGSTYPITSSWSENSLSSSYSTTSSYYNQLWISTGSEYPITSSWSTNSQTSSFITTPTNAFIQNGNAFGTASVLGTTDTQNLQFETNNVIRMTISGSNGFVGINTPQPQHPLSVLTSANAEGIQIRRSASTGGSNEFGLRIASTEGINLAAVRSTRVDGNAGHNLQFLTNPTGNNPTIRMTITSLGSVGIGTESPSASFHVIGNISASAVTASLFGTGSWAITSSNALTISGSITFSGKENGYFPQWVNNRLSHTSSLYATGSGIRISGSLELAGLETTGSTAPVTLQGYFKTNVNGTSYWVPYYSSP